MAEKLCELKKSGSVGGASRPYTFSRYSGNTTLNLKEGDMVFVSTQEAYANGLKVNGTAIPTSENSNTDVLTVTRGQYAATVIVLHDGSFTFTCTVSGGSSVHRIAYPEDAV